MKEIAKIKEELSRHGYNWLPNYKNILEDIWLHMETYMDEDEEVKSALWSSFKRYDDEMRGVVFITSKRLFTIESKVNATQVTYLPFDKYSLEKIQYQPGEGNELSYLSMLNDSFGNGITFGCPSKEVTEHFLTTLRGVSNAEIEVLPPSDKPLLAENEKEQVVDEEPNRQDEHKDHNFIEKHKEEIAKPISENKLWHKAELNNKDKEIPIKIVEAKKTKQQKTKKTASYGSKKNSKIWYFWFTIPVSFIVLVFILAFTL